MNCSPTLEYEHPGSRPGLTWQTRWRLAGWRCFALFCHASDCLTLLPMAGILIANRWLLCACDDTSGRIGGCHLFSFPKAIAVLKQLFRVQKHTIQTRNHLLTATEPSVIEEKLAKQEKKPKVKNDPRLVAAARKLKDRWLEQVNGGLYLPMANGKYEVSRGIESQVTLEPAGLLAA